MSLHSLDYVIEEVIGPEIPYTRRTLAENLRPGRKFDGCARKLGNRWVFTDEDIQKFKDRMLPNLDEDVAQQKPLAPTRLPSGMSPRSPRVRKASPA
ncbi:excisionase [Gordonia phage ThankyouJordi]|uniref:Excise n=1 Tax=Gordonia phage ThankyouJordi TaxID=2571252 RepID=A0A4Y6EGH2_9CAUD|nr:excisionase [Gordonia phage ThankyouJordi]QCW22234.1 hypothetical protein SEA_WELCOMEAYANNA_49 [Gordonia phage WelcomeAyanna]QDF17810.1 hypothetical protein SEA_THANKYOUJORDI_49 [Gordonia phage ThankyouJordi]